MKAKGPVILLILVVASLQNLPAAVKVVEAKKDVNKLVSSIKVAADISLEGTPISAARIDPDLRPSFLLHHDPEIGLAFRTSEQLYIFDPSCASVSKMLPIPNVGWIEHRFPGSGDMLLGHWGGKKWLLSRLEGATGKFLWTTDYEFRSLYGHMVQYGDRMEYFIFHVPISAALSTDGSRLSFAGLVTMNAHTPFLSSAYDIGWGNRILVIDLETGKVLQDDRFDIQRNVDDQRKLFLNFDRNELWTLNIESNEVVARVKLNQGDLLIKKGFAPAIDMRGNADWYYCSDLQAIPTDEGMILISSRLERPLLSGKPQIRVLWLNFDKSGNRQGLISPPPLTTAKFIVRNQGQSSWPIIFIGLENTFHGPTPGNLVILQKDGTLSTAPLPEIKGLDQGPILRFGGLPEGGATDSWHMGVCMDCRFHDGQFMYGLAQGVLYRHAIGETTVTPVFKVPAGSKVESVPDGYGDLAMLKGEKGAMLVRLSDGSQVSEAEALTSAPADLFWALSDANRLASNLPKTGLPATFAKFVKAIFAAHGYGVVEGQFLKAFRIWGRQPSKELGDIALRPALLTDGSAILVGLRLPQNEVVFWVPVLHFEGLANSIFPDGRDFLFEVKYVDERNAFLVVAEKLNGIKVYSITRPPLELN